MKSLLLFTILIFGTLTLQAQENYFLPVSTTSSEAKQAYQDAALSTQHTNLTSYRELMVKAIASDPEFFMALAHWGIGSLNAKNPEFPKGNITKALSVSEDKLTDSEKILRKALVMLNQDLKSDITGVVKELQAAYPTTAQAYDLGLFVNYFYKKDYKEAVKNGEMLVKLAPNLGGGYNMTGYAYMGVGDMKAAKKSFEKYLKKFPQEANPFDSMGEYYMRMKDYKNSAKYYQMAADRGLAGSQSLADEAKSLMAN
jgi:tetratricopeptide (TPR) repeat protein